jgi:hypothetical protein
MSKIQIGWACQTGPAHTIIHILMAVQIYIGSDHVALHFVRWSAVGGIGCGQRS